MVYCWVPFCKSKESSRTKGISFHEIPSDSVLRAKWLKVINRKDLPSADGRTVICSLHFSKEDFHPHSKRKILLKDSVPSNFPSYPEHMQPPKKKARVSPSSRDQPVEKNSAIESAKVNFHETSQVDAVIIPNQCKHCPDLQEISQVDSEMNQSECNDGTSPNQCKHSPDFQEIGQVNSEMNQSECNDGIPTADASVQADFRKIEKKREVFLLKQRLRHYQRALRAKVAEVKCLKEQIHDINNNPSYIKYQNILLEASKGEISASILFDQIKNFNLLKPLWSESTIRFSTVIRNCSSRCYEVIRANKIFRLPSRSTLMNWTGQKEVCSFNDTTNENEFNDTANENELNCDTANENQFNDTGNENGLVVFVSHQLQHPVANED